MFVVREETCVVTMCFTARIMVDISGIRRMCRARKVHSFRAIVAVLYCYSFNLSYLQASY